jgi:SAM-dependent methyltransferase
MRRYSDATYGDRIADRYDEWYAHVPLGGELDATVSFLGQIAAGGPALELGIGTGRVALPLKASAIDLHGIDASRAMVARLHDKPGGAELSVSIGSFADFDLGRRFRLIYVVFNTLFALPTQEEQISCFASVARHLTDDGAFVVEAFVPDPTRFSKGQRVGVVHVGDDEVRLEVSIVEPTTQSVDSQYVVLSGGDVQMFPVRIRFAWPSELDLMARLAGLRLRERWADWDRTPFVGDGAKHISVWERSS